MNRDQEELVFASLLKEAQTRYAMGGIDHIVQAEAMLEKAIAMCREKRGWAEAKKP